MRLKAIGRIVFTKAEDVYRVKADIEHFGSFDTTSPMQRAFGGHTLMRKDGCEHMRERRAMVGAFEPSLLHNHWQTEFDALTETLLDELAQLTTVDLFPALAVPLSAGYLKLVLGIEQATDAQLFRWAQALIRGAMNAGLDPEIFQESDQANSEMNECLDQMIERHLRNPNCSVLSVMVNQPDPIPLSQIRTNMKICIGGAVVETRDAVLSTLYGLLSNPEQLRYSIDQNAWDRVCEEGLRWMAPIQASPRIVKKSLVMRGVNIPKGETVMAIQASANHDEDIWDQPHLFNPQREPHGNQAFGDGSHQCLGGNIYRLLVSKAVLPKLFERFPALSLVNQKAVKFTGFAFRGPTSLPVNLR
ncbi:cytochrome P450 [Parasedimentitalea psychrophila]|nr:cytochrome P450 [Parasedimentitalea psychrophila]